MYQIRKIFKFEGSHALSGSYSKECQKIHGHSYVVEVFLQSETLNEDGMIMDFKMLKEKISGIFDKFDHALVVHANDKRFHTTDMDFNDEYNPVDMYLTWNPTAENMAKYFFNYCKNLSIPINKVRVHETATGWAEYFIS